MLRLGDVTNTFLRYAIRIAIYNPVNRLQNAIKTNTHTKKDTFSVVPTKTKKIVCFFLNYAKSTASVPYHLHV